MADSRSGFDNPEPWEYAFARAMREKRDQLETQIVEGGASDYPAYRELVGQIRGIQNCMTELTQVRARLVNPDGDRDIEES